MEPRSVRCTRVGGREVGHLADIALHPRPSNPFSQHELVSARGHHAHDGSMNRYPASFNGNGIADVVGDVMPWVSDLGRDGTPLTSFLRTYSWETDDEAWWDGSERRIAREERVAPRLAVDGSRRGRGPGRAERLLRDRLPLRSRMKWRNVCRSAALAPLSR